jgi:hypothetical protein
MTLAATGYPLSFKHYGPLFSQLESCIYLKLPVSSSRLVTLLKQLTHWVDFAASLLTMRVSKKSLMKLLQTMNLNRLLASPIGGVSFRKLDRNASAFLPDA